MAVIFGIDTANLFKKKSWIWLLRFGKTMMQSPHMMDI